MPAESKTCHKKRNSNSGDAGRFQLFLGNGLFIGMFLRKKEVEKYGKIFVK